jgi:hypothetical protein
VGKPEEETELRLKEEQELSSSLSVLLCWAAFTLISSWSLCFASLCCICVIYAVVLYMRICVILLSVYLCYCAVPLYLCRAVRVYLCHCAVSMYLCHCAVSVFV